MANLDRIRAVVALIEKDEEDHDGKHFNMSSWVEPPEDPDLPAFCNTTMCFAGWAVIHQIGGIAEFLDRAVEKRITNALYTYEETEEWYSTHWADANIEGEAADYLGLDSGSASQIFYRTSITTSEELKHHITNSLQEEIWEGILPSLPYRWNGEI